MPTGLTVNQESGDDFVGLSAFPCLGRNPGRVPNPAGRPGPSVRQARGAVVKANELAGLPNPAGPVTAAALAWADVSPAADGSGVAIVRRSKTDVEAQSQAVYLGQAAMAALAAIRPDCWCRCCPRRPRPDRCPPGRRRRRGAAGPALPGRCPPHRRCAAGWF